MFLLLMTWLPALLEFIGSTFEESSYVPRSCKCKLKLVNNLTSHIRPKCPTSKDNVANRINSQVRVARINVFTMISTLLLNKQFCNFAAGRQSGSKLLGVQDNSAYRGCQFSMFTTGEIDREGKFLAGGNKTAGNICPRNGAGVPSVKE
jgi:hypothetical protein